MKALDLDRINEELESLRNKNLKIKIEVYDEDVDLKVSTQFTTKENSNINETLITAYDVCLNELVYTIITNEN